MAVRCGPLSTPGQNHRADPLGQRAGATSQGRTPASTDGADLTRAEELTRPSLEVQRNRHGVDGYPLGFRIALPQLLSVAGQHLGELPMHRLQLCRGDRGCPPRPASWSPVAMPAATDRPAPPPLGLCARWCTTSRSSHARVASGTAASSPQRADPRSIAAAQRRCRPCRGPLSCTRPTSASRRTWYDVAPVLVSRARARSADVPGPCVRKVCRMRDRIG